MCQEQHTHPPMPVWLRTPRPHAPDVRPWRPPLQIMMTLSESSPTGRDRSPACVHTALVHHIDPLTVCKTTKPIFQSAFSARTSSWRAVNNFQTTNLSCPLTLLATRNGLTQCYPVRCSESTPKKMWDRPHHRCSAFKKLC